MGREWERERLHRISFQIRRKRLQKMIVVLVGVRITIGGFILSRDIKKILAQAFQVWKNCKFSNLCIFRDCSERVAKAE